MGPAGDPATASDDRVSRHVLDTGYPALNDLLPGGGWPRRSVIEVVVPAWGSGELQPLLPLMARLTTADSQVALVAPPFQPYAPALVQAGIDLDRLLVVAPDAVSTERSERDRDRDAWWAAEKLLRQGDAALVLLWPRGATTERAKRVRRLQLAADRAGGIGVILGRGPVVDSPVGLRLRVERRVKPAHEMDHGMDQWSCRDVDEETEGQAEGSRRNHHGGGNGSGDRSGGRSDDRSDRPGMLPAPVAPVRVSLTKSRYGWCGGEFIELDTWRPGT